MGFVGRKPTNAPLTSSDLGTGIVGSANIADGTIANADIANSTINLTTKVTGTLPLTNGGTGLATLGTAGQALVVNSGASALEFATPSSGAFVFVGETSASNVATVDLNGYFTSSYDYYQVYVDDVYGSVNNQDLQMRFSTTGSYTVQTSQYYSGHGVYQQNAAGDQSPGSYAAYNTDSFIIGAITSSTSTQVSSAIITILNPMGSNVKNIHYSWSTANGNMTQFRIGVGAGRWNSTTAITGLRFYLASGNIYARKIRIYGIKNS
jgi:hypothetical protein